jgi:hypothetical protein
LIIIYFLSIKYIWKKKIINVTHWIFLSSYYPSITYLSNSFFHKKTLICQINCIKKRIVSQLIFFPAIIYLLWSMDTSRGAVSRCPKKSNKFYQKNNVFLCFDTLWINIWHSYDTYTTRVWQYIQTSDWKGICIFRWSNIPYIFFC